MSTLDRRSFLGRTAVVAGGAFAGSTYISGLLARAQGARGSAGLGDGGYGPIAPGASENTAETLLALPDGFRYTVFGRTGTVMSDGLPTPPLHDGMAAFPADAGTALLVRNHEDRNQGPPIGPNPYDALARGGTTTVEIDLSTRLPVRDFVSISGTHTNCAGGPTPWGSWVTCEETTVGTASGYAQPHGYSFEVPASAEEPVDPVPLKAMGRFVHEALAVDAKTGWVYETEDRDTSGIYRFKPTVPGDLSSGGTLEMLAVRDRPNYDARTGQRVGRRWPVIWVPIPSPDPPEAETDTLAVFKQGFERGGATFSRLEGAWYDGGSVFFHSTDGGDLHLGQVWKLDVRGQERLELIFESGDATQLDSPDNITVSPKGGLVLCEDGDGDQYLRGLTKKGQIFDFALNIHPGFETSEFAGATFGPDLRTLFVNIQTPGVTFAIWGPWRKGAL
jgi:secreted PhoX family phosphatase